MSLLNMKKQKNPNSTTVHCTYVSRKPKPLSNIIATVIWWNRLISETHQTSALHILSNEHLVLPFYLIVKLSVLVWWGSYLPFVSRPDTASVDQESPTASSGHILTAAETLDFRRDKASHDCQEFWLDIIICRLLGEWGVSSTSVHLDGVNVNASLPHMLGTYDLFHRHTHHAFTRQHSFDLCHMRW